MSKKVLAKLLFTTIFTSFYKHYFSRNLNQNLLEYLWSGICQLIAYKYMECLRATDSTERLARTSVGNRPTGSESAWDAKLRAFIANQIESDPSPVYGDGFRQAATCSATLGLDILLQFIKDSKSFPQISWVLSSTHFVVYCTVVINRLFCSLIWNTCTIMG